MFCKYCGKPNPDDAAFCSSCGKSTARLSSPQSAPAPAAPPSVEPHVGPVAIPVSTMPAAAPPPIKKRRISWGLAIFALIVVFVLYYPHKDGNTICSATQEEVMEQVPYSVDILAVRHPVAVGILRSALDQESVNKLAESYVASSMNAHDPTTFDCYASYYAILFNKDKVRSSIADWMEKQLNLSN